MPRNGWVPQRAARAQAYHCARLAAKATDLMPPTRLPAGASAPQLVTLLHSRVSVSPHRTLTILQTVVCKPGMQAGKRRRHLCAASHAGLPAVGGLRGASVPAAGDPRHRLAPIFRFTLLPSGFWRKLLFFVSRKTLLKYTGFVMPNVSSKSIGAWWMISYQGYRIK